MTKRKFLIFFLRSEKLPNTTCQILIKSRFKLEPEQLQNTIKDQKGVKKLYFTNYIYSIEKDGSCMKPFGLYYLHYLTSP